jgi:formylmethanofuran--tetrahydromethanopterin N-formyltransferase
VQTMTGFATSVIGCKVEAAMEAELSPDGTPDGRTGRSACYLPSTRKDSRSGCWTALGRLF